MWTMVLAEVVGWRPWVTAHLFRQELGHSARCRSECQECPRLFRLPPAVTKAGRT
ncbi:hypothetical protein BC628DRAFT_1403230 [Trametes gibbosa]|nr:hypothetical protein BC628DRAFT_1403230 [Trametes gibbosa]